MATKIQAAKFIKLGTAVRYLMEIDGGAIIGGKHVLSNLDAVLNLTEELGFKITIEQKLYENLKVIRSNLSNAGRLNITEQEAEAIRIIARKYRQSLMTEGNSFVLYQEPSKGVFGFDLRKITPLKMLSLLVTSAGILYGVFYLGLRLGNSEYGPEIIKFLRVVEGDSASNVVSPNQPSP